MTVQGIASPEFIVRIGNSVADTGDYRKSKSDVTDLIIEINLAQTKFQYRLENIERLQKNQSIILGSIIANLGVSREMNRPISKPDWWVNLHPRHIVRMGFAALLMLVGLVDFSLNVAGVWSLMHWSLDILLAWGGFSLLITATLLAMHRGRNA